MMIQEEETPKEFEIVAKYANPHFAQERLKKKILKSNVTVWEIRFSFTSTEI